MDLGKIEASANKEYIFAYSGHKSIEFSTITYGRSDVKNSELA